MSRHASLALCTLVLTLLSPCLAPAADWPEFRGPKRDNVSPDKGLLTSWPKDGPKLAWKGVGVGDGFSSVSVAGDKIFTMGDKDRQCWVFALDRATGKNVWSAKIGQAGGNKPGPRCTPTVDGDRVYAVGQFGDLVCLDAATGQARWRKSYKDDFKGRHGSWNFAESPLVDGDRLVCTPGAQDATMVALDKMTGKEIWRCPARSAAGYSSIVISKGGNIKQYVTLAASGTIGVDAEDGKLLWHYKKLGGTIANIPTPIVLNDQIFTCAGYNQGGALLTLSAGVNGVKYKEEYFNDALKNKHGGVTIVGNLIFGDSNDTGRPFCADWKTGKILWTRTGRGDGSAAIAYADGHLYVRYQNGRMVLAPATADGYAEKGSFKIPNSGSNSWPHPVVIGGRMYLREKDTLYCYDVRGN